MNKMAFVGKVVALSDVENSDRLSSATVVCGTGGKWTGVVGRGQFQMGSLCRVFLPDALLPATDEFKFMEKQRRIVRQCRLRGAVSEVLIMPFAEATELEVGADITDAEKVLKYDKPLAGNISGDIKGHFPSFIPKTDELNFQTARHLVDALRGHPFYATEKADGSSGTIFRHEGQIGVCSRNYELKDTPTQLGWTLARQYDLVNKLPDEFAVQFEIIGPKIQGNPMGQVMPDMRLFNVWSIVDRRYLSYEDVCHFSKDMGIPTVALIMTGDYFDMNDDQLRELARGNYANGRPREGVVIRPMVETNVDGDRLSFKVINLEYKG